MNTLHCALENGADLYVTSVRRYDTITLGLLKKEEERRRMPSRDFFTSRGAYVKLHYICNVWVWLVGAVSRRRVWLVEVGGIYGYS